MLRWNFNFPLPRRALGDHQRKRRFAELNETAIAGPSCEHYVPCNFFRSVIQAPYCLALTNRPTRFLKIDFWQRRRGTATQAGKEWQEPKQAPENLAKSAEKNAGTPQAVRRNP
jgi:hypothetical protein